MTGYVILIQNEGRRQDGVADPSQDIVTLARAVYPLGKDANNADKLEAAAKLERDTATAKSCDDIVVLNNSYNAGVKSLIENVTIGSFNRPLQSLINNLKVAVPSKPLAFNDSLSVFMLCNARAQPSACHHATIYTGLSLIKCLARYPSAICFVCVVQRLSKQIHEFDDEATSSYHTW